jgi:DNA-binding transcriptional ArsR family regulator
MGARNNWLVEFEKAISEQPSKTERALKKLEEGGMVRIAFEDGEVYLWQERDRCLYQVWKSGRLVRKGEVTTEFVRLLLDWLELTFQSWRIQV